MRRCIFTFSSFFVLCAAPLAAQDPAAADTFHDANAQSLLLRARTARAQADRSLRSYTAVIKSRVATGLRMGLKDRSLFRQETAARIRWSRDTASIVQMLASRAQHPGGVWIPRGMSGLGIEDLYNPNSDRMYFGLSMWEPIDGDDNEDFFIEHPLADSAERHYRYQTGDSFTVALQDGRVLRTVELIVTPRRSNPHTVHGAITLEAESGSVVQATFRLARAVNVLKETEVIDPQRFEGVEKIPGLITPIEFNINLMTVEYSLWEMKHWLPYTMRFDGTIRMGIASIPASADVNYDITEVLAGDSAAEPEGRVVARTKAQWLAAGNNFWRPRLREGTSFIVIMPRNPRSLLRSSELPPAIWTDAPGFVSSEQIERLYDRLARITDKVGNDAPTQHRWLARYNRVEALSVGASVATGTPVAMFDASARLGIGDLQPNVDLALRRESMRRSIQLRAYHHLTAVDETRSPLGIANSVASLLFGRDEGDYYRASGASLTWTPPPMLRQSWDVTGYAEYQDDVARNTHIALPRIWGDSVFRSNITADEATQYGALLRVHPWWGTNPRGRQGGIELMMQGESGDYRHARTSVTVRGASPLFNVMRLGAEAAVGTSTGDVTVQRLFYLGGGSTLRGYEPGTIVGTSMVRARVDIARPVFFANVGVFSDWGWAGDRTADITRAQQRLSVGAGASLLDGLVRIDLARGLWAPRGWRLDLSLDAIL